jgi:hypothetical protein
MDGSLGGTVVTSTRNEHRESEMLEDRLHDLRAAASDVRLQSYRQSDQGDVDTVVHYLWNVRLSEALYPILAIFEVTLRNQVHNALTQRYGTENWFDQKGVLHEREVEEIEEAREALRRNDKPVDADHIVAQMSLGFWCALLQDGYDDRFWEPDGGALLKAVFPYAPEGSRSRNDLWKICNSARVLRNRVAHYRPVYNQPDLADVHADTVAVIGWMSLAMADLVTLTDRFDEVWDNGENQARGRLGELWRLPGDAAD